MVPEPPTGRVMRTTTISAEADAFFREHDELALGRCVDKWVREQKEKEAGSEEDKFAARIAALQTGGCACGRILYPSRKLQRVVCPGCMGEPQACGCGPTQAVRERHFLEWQQARQVAGLKTTREDMEAEKKRLGFPEYDEVRQERLRAATQAHRQERLLSEAGEKARQARERAEVERIANMTPEETAAHVARLRELQGGEQYAEYRGPARGAKGAKVRRGK